MKCIKVNARVIFACAVSAALLCVAVIASQSAPKAGAAPLSTSILHSKARAVQVTSEALATAPAAQRAALGDGQVTIKEYRDAIRATRSCIAADAREILKNTPVDYTIDVSEPVLTSDEFQYTYDWGFTASGSEDEGQQIAPQLREQLLGAARGCEENFRDATEGVYLAQKQADAVYIEQQVARFSKCLEERRILPGGTSVDPKKLDNLYGSITAQRKFAVSPEAKTLTANPEEAYSCLSKYTSLAEQSGK
jgi:hypothetical protein